MIYRFFKTQYNRHRHFVREAKFDRLFMCFEPLIMTLYDDNDPPCRGRNIFRFKRKRDSYCRTGRSRHFTPPSSDQGYLFDLFDDAVVPAYNE